MPKNAAIILAQSEFNRFYIRGLCLRAINENIDTLKIYRARESSQKRPKSEAKIGTCINARELLEDIRTQ